MVQELIEKAKNKYPVSIYYTGQLSEEEITVLEKVCDVKCPSVYMSGSATYSIKNTQMVTIQGLAKWCKSKGYSD